MVEEGEDLGIDVGAAEDSGTDAKVEVLDLTIEDRVVVVLEEAEADLDSDQAAVEIDMGQGAHQVGAVEKDVNMEVPAEVEVVVIAREAQDPAALKEAEALKALEVADSKRKTTFSGSAFKILSLRFTFIFSTHNFQLQHKLTKNNHKSSQICVSSKIL